MSTAASEDKSLWEQIGNTCLTHALTMPKGETAPTAATVETVRKLVDIAVSIDLLNLRWERQNQSCAAVFPGQPFYRK